MASTIIIKNGTGSAVPSSLTQGELAINVDNGAEQALMKSNASLLYKGIVECSDDISRGDCVTIYNSKGVPIAKGITSWSSDEIRKAMSKKSSANSKSVVHKDNLIIL